MPADPVPATTEAAVLVETGQPLELRTLTIGVLRPGQVLVEVAWSGICRSQLLEVDGGRGVDRYLPHCLGHEGAGVVFAVGEGVTKVAPGDHAVLTWLKGNGADVSGTVYESDAGPVNAGLVTTFGRHAIVSESRVVPIPHDVPLREAALLGCAIPTGAGAVLNTADATPEDTVAVVGAGGVGLAAILGARLAGAARVIAVDVRAETLALAARLGATEVVDASQGAIAAALLDLTEGRGADVVIEAVGRVDTMEAAYAATRNGGICVIAGNPRAGERISLDPMDLIRGRRIVGTWGGDTVPDRDVPHYLAAYAEGRLPLADVIGGEYALAEVNEALDALRRGATGRLLLDLSR